MRGPYTCLCCGQEESTSGCVRGLRCGCDDRSKCPVCLHCTEHHHKGCTQTARYEFDAVIQAVRDKYEINIFEPGVVKPANELSGWYRSTPSGDVIDW